MATDKLWHSDGLPKEVNVVEKEFSLYRVLQKLFESSRER